MKTTANNSRYLKRTISFAVFMLMLICVLVCKTLQAQSVSSSEKPASKNYHDPNFPALKGLNAGMIATYTNVTPPPAVIADVTYRLSDRIAVGALAGTTGAIAVAGVKFNANLFQSSTFRINSRTVIVYYPERNGKFLFDRTDKRVMPWMLSMSVVDAELQSGRGIRYSLGVGVLETHCVEGMKKYFWGHADETRVMPFEFFQTVQGSVAMPVGRRLTFRPEVILIMKKFELIPANAFRVSPINPYLKFIYTF